MRFLLGTQWENSALKRRVDRHDYTPKPNKNQPEAGGFFEEESHRKDAKHAKERQPNRKPFPPFGKGGRGDFSSAEL
jgi:hypothetical protein